MGRYSTATRNIDKSLAKLKCAQQCPIGPSQPTKLLAPRATGTGGWLTLWWLIMIGTAVPHWYFPTNEVARLGADSAPLVLPNQRSCSPSRLAMIKDGWVKSAHSLVARD